ncbi:membrane protein [Streptomyces sulfonofaciens]|uniref:Endolytic murein transglycosylase n=1 Tax=Streptomyces sulfonofaciens TaxID=68272 RepID=A0A919G0C0_9ACTN|nr:endolytic transglycosylase MltG [Streptomyces sulfonofaciens]GHH75710.1 membrane protein [Streptomyces sulfonofaciens]
MTEYGRGPGSEPWHPEDPLYGELGYDGQQQAPAGHPPYGDQTPEQYPYEGQQQYYPQQQAPQHPQQPQPYDQWGTGQHLIPGQQQPHGHPHLPPQQMPGQQQGPAPVPDQQGHPQMPGGPFHPQVPGQAYGDHGGYPGQEQDPGYGQQYPTGWDTAPQGQALYGAGPEDPYGQQPHGYQNEEPGPYGDPAGYPYGEPPPPVPPAVGPPGGRGPQRRPAPEPDPEPPIDWDPGPDQGEHAFFAGGDEDDEDDDLDPGGRSGRRGSGGRGERRGRGGKGRKRRSGYACLVVAVVLVGGVSGVGYFGYQFYENHFGPPPDFSGAGTGRSVTVEIPKGAGGYTIGKALKEKGVVKSVDAFVHAQEQNPKGQSIQDGVYTLREQMSAESAVSLMLDPKSRNNLIIAEGRRNAWVYDQLDKRLGLKPGTTKSVAEEDVDHLGLPSWAKDHENVKDPLEGFLYPSSYPVAKGMKPQDVLKRMVSAATQKYDSEHLQAQAERLHLDGPWQVITVASLVQAEGKTHDDFRKMAEVVYNRLKPTNTQTNQLLQFDSTFNYLMGQSNINISESEINSNHDPYNTYTQKGLTPGPIGNPGAEALTATLHPTHDGWFYFVATDGMNKTEFARTYADFQRLKEKFNDHSGSN